MRDQLPSTTCKAEGRWVEYPIYQQGTVWKCDIHHTGRLSIFLSHIPSIVGFGGVQFEEQGDDTWYFVLTAGAGTFSHIAACWCEATKYNVKPATPVKARFWVEG